MTILPSRTWERLAFVLVLAVSLQACGGSETGRVTEASRDLAEALTQASEVSPEAAPSTSSESAAAPRIYIDASRSMRGFVGPEARTQFDQVLDQVTTTLGATRLYAFGRGGDGTLIQERASGQAIHQADFFDRGTNPDHELFEQIATDSLRRPAIYFSDGVLSTTDGQSQGPVKAVLARHLQAGGGLAILAFRSDFLGDLWSEERQQFISTSIEAERPFYAFVLAPTVATLDAVLDRIDFRDPALELRFSASGADCQATGGALDWYDRSTVGAEWGMLSAESFSERAAEPVTVADYACEIAPWFPASALAPTVDARYAPWDFAAKTFGDAADVGDLSADGPTLFAADAERAETTPAGSATPITARLAPDPSTTFGLYAVSFTPAIGAYRPEIAALSTESDATADAAGKTYRFDWLVRELTREVMPDVRSGAPFFLTLTYP